MSLFGDIANALGHTVDSLAQEVGEAVGTLENLINEFDSNGIDVITAASKLNLPVASFLRSILDLMGGDPHQRLLQHLVGPVQPASDPINKLSSQWLQMGQLHQNTAQQINTHMNDLFFGSTTDSYRSPAADALLSTHQDYQQSFTALVDHAQTQQGRHATLGSNVDDYLNQASGKVYSLSTPMAALGVLSMDTAVADPPTLIPPEFIQGVENTNTDLEQEEQSTLPGPENPWWDFLALCIIVLLAFVGIMLLINWFYGLFNNHQNQQKSTPLPKKSLKPGQPGQGPQNTLSPAQEDLAKRLHNDYSHLGLSLDDIEKIIEDNPNLTEAQLRSLLAQYGNVINANPNLVKQYGALAVFTEFIALAAYDTAHGGNYALRQPVVNMPDDLQAGIEEATAEMGALENGLVPWPLTPSSTDPKYEATDPTGQKWDEKSYRSVNTNGNAYNAQQTVQKLQKDFDNNEKIIFNDSQLTQQEIDDTYDALKRNGQENDVVWWPTEPTPLKSP